MLFVLRKFCQCEELHSDLQNWDHSSITILYYYKTRYLYLSDTFTVTFTAAASGSIPGGSLSHSELKASENVV